MRSHMFRYGAPLLIAVWISREAQPTEHNAPKHGNGAGASYISA